MATSSITADFDLRIQLEHAVAAFREQIESVDKLMNFDREVLDIAIGRIALLREQLTQMDKSSRLQSHAETTVRLLKNIRTNNTLRHRYETIFNQALVLIVSYFSSSMHDLFCRAVSESLSREAESALLREQFRMTFRDLRDANFELRDRAPDLLVLAKDISFQDMQSIVRAFNEYLGIPLESTDMVNDIIVGLSCRHAIVHTGGIADTRLMRQLTNAVPRRIKPEIVPSKPIQFSDAEVLQVAQCMLAYLESAAKKVMERFGLDPKALLRATSRLAIESGD